MTFANRVKETTTSTSTASVILGGTTPGYRTVESAFTAGQTGVEFMVGPDSAGAWLLGEYTIGSGTLTRSAIIDSSAAGADVTLAAGTKDVYATVSAAALGRMPQVRSIPYSTAVPLNKPGVSRMPDQNISGGVTFAVSGTPTFGAQAYVRITPTSTGTTLAFSGMLEWGGSMGYDSRVGIANQVIIFHDGTDTFYSISQAAGATASTAATGVTMSGPTSGTVAIASTNFTVGVSPGGATIAGTLVVTPSDGGAGGTFAPTSCSLTTAAPTGTFAYTAASSGGKTISVTNSGGLTNPASITFSAAAADTSVPDPTSVTASQSGSTSANGSATVGEANGTLYYLYSTSGTATPTAVKAGSSLAISSTGAKTINGSGLTASTTYYLHVLHRDAAGNDSAVVTSASFITSASATAPATMAKPTATAGPTSVSVAFTAPADGGSAITNYTATWSGGGSQSGVSSPIVINGLTAGVAGTVTVTATNGVGTSAPSPASDSVTPTAAVAYKRATSRIGLTESPTGPYSYTGAAGGTFDTQRAVVDGALGTTGDGYATFMIENTSGANFLCGPQQLDTHTGYSGGFGGYIWISGGNWAFSANGTAGAVMAVQARDRVRLRRTAGVWYAEVARDADPTNFTIVRTWTGFINTYDNIGINCVSTIKFTIVDSSGLV